MACLISLEDAGGFPVDVTGNPLSRTFAGLAATAAIIADCYAINSVSPTNPPGLAPGGQANRALPMWVVN